MVSMKPPRPTPAMSLMVLPRAAAAMVDMPMAIPTVMSMYSPALDFRRREGWVSGKLRHSSSFNFRPSLISAVPHSTTVDFTENKMDRSRQQLSTRRLDVRTSTVVPVRNIELRSEACRVVSIHHDHHRPHHHLQLKQEQLTTIMIALSMIPKPTNGTALMKATLRSCRKVGSRTVYSIPSSASFNLLPLPWSIFHRGKWGGAGAQ